MSFMSTISVMEWYELWRGVADVYTVYKLYIPLDSVVIFATNDDNPEETNSYDRLHNTVGNFTPGTTIVTDAWRGYQTVAQLSNGVYDHAVIVHAHEFIDSVDRDIHTETIEGMWKQEKHKLRYQSGTIVCLPATWRPFSGTTFTNRMCSAAICKCYALITIFSS